MSQSQEKVYFTHNDKTMSFSSFSKLCTEALKEKITSKSEQKYFNVLEIVHENELHYDSLKLFSKLVSNLLRAGAKDLIYAILNNPPKYDPLSPHQYIKSFGAYRDFCINLLSFDCSYILEVTELVLNQALNLCTTCVSEQITIKIGERHVFSSVEDVQKRARDILKGSKKKFTQIQNRDDEEYMSG